MNRYTVEQRVFIVRTYWKTASIKECQRQFIAQFGVRKPPAKSSIQYLVKKLETTGTLLDVHEGGRPKLPEATVQEVKNRLLASPQKSLRKLSQEMGVSTSTCQRAAKKAKLHAYRVTAVHELKPPDEQKRLNYCHWFQQFVNAHPGILDYTWFHLSGHVNSQNTRIWASENPNTVHETPLHDEKIGVWCALSRRRIIGPIFFHTTVDTAVYMEIFQAFVNQLDDVELRTGYFQQDGATCHTSNVSMAEIVSFFEDRVLSKGLWPPRSPDLTPPDFFLWGMLKGKVYRNKPRTLMELQENIRREIEAVTPDVLVNTFRNMERRVQACLDANGDHFQHLL